MAHAARGQTLSAGGSLAKKRQIYCGRETNIFENEQIENAFAEFQTNVLDTDFFDEFYINFGNNN